MDNPEIQQEVKQESATQSQTVVSQDQGLGKAFTELEGHVKEVTNDLKNDSRDQKTYMLFGFFILAVMVITLLIQSFNASQAAFQDLKDQVTAQNNKMDLLIQEYGKK